MKALILIAILIGAPFLIQCANALPIDIKPLCLSEAIRDNGTNIPAIAHTFDRCTEKMQMLDNNIHAAGIKGDVGNTGAAVGLN